MSPRRTAFLITSVFALGIVLGAGALFASRMVGIAPPGPSSSGGPLVLELAEADGDAAGADDRSAVPRAVDARPLDAGESDALLAKLPPIERREDDEQDVRLPDPVVPPPRPGATEKAPWPAPASDAEPPGGPGEPGSRRGDDLRVLRITPEGEVGLAPKVSVTFDQPMVGITSHETLAKADVPVRFDIGAPGGWRWLGTRTLQWVPDARRLPMATRYEVVVPAGTASAIRGVLREEVRVQFRTPPPSLERAHPTGGSQPLQPVVVLVFDQRVRPADVVAHARLEADGRELALRLATKDELEADEAAHALFEAARERHAVALRPERELPAGAAVRVILPPGLASAEGPLTTVATTTTSFSTHGPLRLVDHDCSWHDDCPPVANWYLRFSNPLADEQDLDSLVSVRPAVENFRVRHAGNTLTLSGGFTARTTYRVTVGGSLRDVFGQRLGDAETVTFRVGPARPRLVAPGGPFVVLDPSGPRAMPLAAAGHERLRARVLRVGPSDWGAYGEWLRHRWDDTRPEPPGELVRDEVIEVPGSPDELTEVSIPIGDAANAIVVVEPTTGPESDRRQQRVVAWVQSTQIGVVAIADADELLAWVTSLATGSPVEGATVSFGGDSPVATSDARGIARLPLPPSQGRGTMQSMLIVESGDERAFVPESQHPWGGGGWQRSDPGAALRWMVFDDRNLYRPGETVHVKGWIRRVEQGEGGDLEPAPAGVSVAWTLQGARGNELAKGVSEVDAFGGFALDVRLPDDANLGRAQLRLEADDTSLPGRQHWHALQVQEFRRPTFEVALDLSDGPHVVGDAVRARATARYLAGGALAAAPVRWTASSSETTYEPPGWSEFTFGRWQPWWWHGPFGFGGGGGGGGADNGRPPVTLETTTDAAGVSSVEVRVRDAEPALPARLTIEAVVEDVDRQVQAASDTVLVHPADAYVGIELERAFVGADEDVVVEVVVVDREGTALPGRQPVVTLARVESRFRGGEWSESEEVAATCTPTSGSEPVACRLEHAGGGSYRLRAVITDAAGRESLTERTVWISGADQPPDRRLERGTVELIPESEDHAPGDVARILVRAPFAPAEGLLTLRRSGLIETRPFTMDSATTTLEIPVLEHHIPNVHVGVDLVGAVARTDEDGRVADDVARQPAHASGTLDLPVSTRSRELDVTILPAVEALRPGGRTHVDVAVLDASGEPARADVAVAVVDEAVLALAGWELPNPVDVMYERRPPGVQERRLRDDVILALVEEVQAVAEVQVEAFEAGGAKLMRSMAAADMAASPPPSAQSSAGDGGAAVTLRKDFRPIALWAPAVRTGPDGRARVELPLPDDLTRWRLVAVAANERVSFGADDATLTARLPLSVRVQAPRFLRWGDSFELPIIVQDQAGVARTVRLAARADGLAIDGAAGRRIDVPANGRVEVRIPMEVTRVGTGRIQVVAVSGDDSDAAEIDLPIYTPATVEAFAEYGSVAGDEELVVQPVVAPDDVLPQFGGLSVSLSSTQLQALTDAVIHLVDYPFGCTEQLASRVLAIAALSPVLDAFDAPGLPPEDELRAAVARDVARIAERQRDDGGFGFWRPRAEAYPWASIHATHALVRAKDADFAVPDATLERALDHLRHIEHFIPANYSESARRAVIAHALFVRQLAGDGDPSRARRLLDEAGGVESAGVETVALLVPTLSGAGAGADSSELLARVRRSWENRVEETAAGATITTDYGGDAWLLFHSSRRTDALVLEAALVAWPDWDVSEKLVRSLLGHRVKGRWSSTQENAWVLLAMKRYFEEREGTTPAFVARAWLGSDFLGRFDFDGRDVVTREVSVPMDALQRGDVASDVLVAKDGPGRLYYRMGLTYAPADLDLEPLERGFVVERTYEAVDDDGDVTRDADGTWRIAAGARVRITTSLVAPARRTHVALVDPLPAGLEPLNAALATTESVPPNESGDDDAATRPWWRWRWEHVNLRDHRTEAFAGYLGAGVYEHEVVCRATTPGRFVASPPRAEEMYHPETFGRGATDVVVIE